MNDKLIFTIGMAFAGVLFVVIAILLALKLKDDKYLKSLENFTRNRYIGAFLGFLCLLWCIPHARVVSPDFLLPLLFPLAIIVPIASFFTLDYINARAIGGLMIIFSYFSVHGAFEQQLSIIALVAISGWITGIAGIIISGKPCFLRDWLRICVKSSKIRVLSSITSLIFGIIWIISAMIVEIF